MAELSRRQTRTRRAIREARRRRASAIEGRGRTRGVAAAGGAPACVGGREEARVELHQLPGELDPLLADHPFRGAQAHLAQVGEVHLAGRVHEDVARVQVGMGEARILGREAEFREASRQGDPGPPVLENLAQRRRALDPAQTQRPAATEALDAQGFGAGQPGGPQARERAPSRRARPRSRSLPRPGAWKTFRATSARPAPRPRGRCA